MGHHKANSPRLSIDLQVPQEIIRDLYNGETNPRSTQKVKEGRGRETKTNDGKQKAGRRRRRRT
jgi:hypothetical protein